MENEVLKLNFSTEEEKSHVILSDETAQILTIALQYVISPVIGVVGTIFNILSIIVLFKHGLHKCSNILLFSLAFMDICLLVGYNNIPSMLYSGHGGGRFMFSEPVSLLLFVLCFFFMILDYGLGLAGWTVPMLITIERMVAVFMPLKFGQIITPTRTWAAIAGTVLFWIGTIIYTCFWYKFEYIFDEKLNRSVGLILKSELFYDDLDMIPIFQEVFFSLKVPPLVTVIGCVAIIAKVKVTSRKRSEMMSSKVASTSKTTQTLLAVCITYLLACLILAIPTYLPAHLSAYSLTNNNPTNMGVIIYLTVCVFTTLNSSWNFLIYVGLNKNFRDTFREMVSGKKNKS